MFPRIRCGQDHAHIMRKNRRSGHEDPQHGGAARTGGRRGRSGRRAGQQRYLRPDVQAIYGRWTQFREWASSFTGEPAMPVEPARLGAPAPLPPQVFAVGLNYREHAQEAGAGTDSQQYPTVFTKFPASVTGPYAKITLSGDTVDYEAELCLVIGKRADYVTAADAWDYVAGLTVGQDISDRRMQLAGAAPQRYCLAKSYRGFAPVGPGWSLRTSSRTRMIWN
jgi:2-keto-4-pentenoate hydratase/2-oxohepta-3-ene-1,7-dioic acid hydratase in catechol pathway